VDIAERPAVQQNPCQMVWLWERELAQHALLQRNFIRDQAEAASARSSGRDEQHVVRRSIVISHDLVQLRLDVARVQFHHNRCSKLEAPGYCEIGAGQHGERKGFDCAGPEWSVVDRDSEAVGRRCNLKWYWVWTSVEPIEPTKDLVDSFQV